MKAPKYLWIYLSLYLGLQGTICPYQMQAQVLDIVRLEHTSISRGEGISYNRQRFMMNLPVKIKDDAYWLLGVDYSRIELDFKEEVSEFNTNDLTNFNILDLSTSYTYKMNEDWRFAANLELGFSSNFSRSTMLSDDFVLSALVVFIKDKKEAPDVPKPYRWILGAAFSENSGVPFPIPFVSYYLRFRPRWSLNLGVPTANLQYRISEKVRLKAVASLDGFESNLQERIPVNGDEQADRIRMAVIVGGLRTEYNFSKHVESFLVTNYVLSNNIHLRRGVDRLITLNHDNRLYVRIGIRVKP